MSERPENKSATLFQFFHKFLTKILNHRITGYLKKFRELFVLLAFYTPYLITVLSHSPLTVDYKSFTLDPPLTMTKVLGDDRSGLSNKTRSQLSKYITSPQILRVRIRNDSMTRVTDFDLKINGVVEVSDIGVWTNSSVLMRDAEKIGEVQRSPSGVIAFPNLTYLPPGSSITLTLWGEFGRSLWTPEVSATASQWKPEVSRFGEVTGYLLFIEEHSGPLVGIGIAILLLIGVKRASKEK